MSTYAYYTYIEQGGEKFFTVVVLPEKEGKFPIIICRTPYVGHTVNQTEDALVEGVVNAHAAWTEHGYAVVYQHCKGQGKSTGAFVPYVHEREDGLALRRWIREQSFYNGELYLLGGSYTASLHYTTAPFEEDIRGAVLEVQDSERYRLWYRGGQMRKGHANWHFGLYKSKCGLDKHFDMGSFAALPLAGLSKDVLCDRAEDFEEMLLAPHPTDRFWETRNGGIEAKGAIDHANIPILLTTGYNDFYVGGMFDMWRHMDMATKAKCAMLVSPYNHGDGYDANNGMAFPLGKRGEQFGKYHIAWFEHIRKKTPLPFPKGKITYYRAFENIWANDFEAPTHPLTLPLGNGARTFVYDPKHPTAFSCEGSFARETFSADEVISVCTPAFDQNTFVRGQMRVTLTVSSSAPDTSFYVRLCLRTSAYTYILRHDITSLCHQRGDYTPNTPVTLDFTFDEYAFLISAGQCLQIDIASTDDNTYVSHTNKAGAYALQTDADIARNTVYLSQSTLTLPVE